MASVGRVSEIYAVSEVSFDDAIQSAIRRAGETLRGMESAQVVSQEVLINPRGGISGYRVTLAVHFVLDEFSDLMLPAIPNPATQTAEFG